MTEAYPLSFLPPVKRNVITYCHKYDYMDSTTPWISSMEPTKAPDMSFCGKLPERGNKTRIRSKNDAFRTQAVTISDSLLKSFSSGQILFMFQPANYWWLFMHIKINDVLLIFLVIFFSCFSLVSSPCSLFHPLHKPVSSSLFPCVFLWADARRTICAHEPNASRHYANFFHRGSEIFAQLKSLLREDAFATYLRVVVFT